MFIETSAKAGYNVKQVGVIRQGSHGHGKSLKTMENKKIKSKLGKVMEF